MMPNKIACFITAHGFGHAARSCAILNACQDLEPEIEAKIFSNVPLSFFDESLQIPFSLEQPCENDVGLIQTTTFHHDVPATLEKLQNFLPFETKLLASLASEIADCTKVYCDISPLGISVAKHANLPVTLFENFTWDWIYEPFLKTSPGFQEPIDYLHEIYDDVDLLIQSEPLCHRLACAQEVDPVSRPPRTSREEVREILNIPESHDLILISRAGNIADLEYLPELKKHSDAQFLFAGGINKPIHEDNLHFLPFSSNLYHPDLIHAADLVIGKAGYGMISETYAAGTPFAYIARDDFRESDALQRFLQQSSSNFSISQEDYLIGAWAKNLGVLRELPRAQPQDNGADQAACLMLGRSVG